MSKVSSSLRDLKTFLQTFFPNLSSYEEWVITNLSFTKDILWNIVMCYCIQSLISKRQEFLLRLTEDSSKMKLFYMNFQSLNTFGEKSKLRDEGYVKGLLPVFESKIHSYHDKNQSKFHSEHEQYVYLQASSILLDINIVLIIKQKNEFGEDEVYTKLFPDSLDVKLPSRERCVVIVDDVIQTSERFSFCLTQKTGFRYRIRILKSILQSLGVDKREYNKIFSSSNIEENVLYHILECAENEKIFPNLEKLQTAGFDIYKHHTLERILKQSRFEKLIDKYMVLFYNIVLDRNYCSWSESPDLFPDLLLLKKLNDFQHILSENASQITSFKTNLYTKRKLDVVRTYNTFIISICSELGKINRKREKNSRNCSINIFYEASLREDMIKCILRVFSENLSEMSLIKRKSEVEEEYVKNIKLNVAVMYFENLFFLVEDMVIPDEKLGILMNLANELYKICWGKLFYEKFQKLYKTYTESNEVSYKIREEKNQDIFVKIIDWDILFKECMPEIYEHLLLSQLHYYLSIILSVMDPKKSPNELAEIKYFLTVDRCLQIAQKYLNEEKITLSSIVMKQILNGIIYYLQDTYVNKKTAKCKMMCFQRIKDFLVILGVRKKIFGCKYFGRSCQLQIPMKLVAQRGQLVSSAEVELQDTKFPSDIDKDILKSIYDSETKKEQKNIRMEIVCDEKSSITEDYESDIVSHKGMIGTVKDSKDRLLLLRTQMELLKNILIDADERIKKQWESEEYPENDLCLRYKLTHLYLNEPEIQASAETLLYRCMDLLKTDELTNLWSRTASVFNAVNIRNTLIKHTNCLISPLMVFSSPMDFIKKCTELIADRKTIDNILTFKHTKVDFYGFLDIVEEEYDDKYKTLREEIISCDRWKEYALLISWNDSCTDSKNPS